VLSHILKDNVQCKERVCASLLFTSLFLCSLQNDADEGNGTIECVIKLFF
jgi:hypothetical protein